MSLGVSNAMCTLIGTTPRVGKPPHGVADINETDSMKSTVGRQSYSIRRFKPLARAGAALTTALGLGSELVL